MMEEKVDDFNEKQARMIGEIVEVFERNDANLLEIYRVLAIVQGVTRTQLRQMLAELGEQADSLMEGIDGLLGESE